MRKNRYLHRLERLRDNVCKWIGKTSHPPNMERSDFATDAEWTCWRSLLLDIKHCSLYTGYRVDPERLAHYNSLWLASKGQDVIVGCVAEHRVYYYEWK